MNLLKRHARKFAQSNFHRTVKVAGFNGFSIVTESTTRD
jgi:hypothetical protein